MMQENHMWKDIYEIAGEALAKKLLSLPEDMDSIIKWFYAPNNALGNKSPREFCKQGERAELERMVTDIIVASHTGWPIASKVYGSACFC